MRSLSLKGPCAHVCTAPPGGKVKVTFPASMVDEIVSLARRSPGGGSKCSVIRRTFFAGPDGTSDTISVLDLGLAFGQKPLSAGVRLEGIDGGIDP